MAAFGGSVSWKSNVPFSDELMFDIALSRLSLLNIEYDGTTDPWDHLCRFESLNQLYRYSEGIKCRLFVTTLSKSAARWFYQLPAKSIHNFDQLSLAFMKKYRICHRKYKNTLGSMKQKDEETLRSYVERFGMEAVKMPSATEDDLVRHLIGGLRYTIKEMWSLYSITDRTLDNVLDWLEMKFDIDEPDMYYDNDGNEW